MKILISNDDGVHALGLSILEKALAEIAEITVVAPDRDRSGASNSLTLQNPLRVREIDNKVFSVQGTPTDCVHLALTGLLAEMPDLVVSGINAGSNLGDDVFYSGTVAAAMEGRFLGIPAIAFSLVGGEFSYPDTATKVARQLVDFLYKEKESIPAKTILNVNVPDLPFEDLQGFITTRLGTRHMAEKMEPDKDPRGHKIYWIGASGKENDAGIGTDFHAISQQQVSITPLQLDLTHYSVRDQLEKKIAAIGNKI